MADLVTVFHPLGWPVEVGQARAEVFRARGYTDQAPQVDTGEDSEVLKGEALDAALKEAGLPVTGKADEKRARLAEHLATNPTNPTE